MEKYERACCIQGYHEYKVLTALLMAFVYISRLHCHVCRAIAWVGRTILRDLKDHLVAWSSFKLTSQMRTSREPSQEQSIQNGRLCVYIACVRITNLHSQKFFVCLIVNTKLFPIYETSKIKPEDPNKSMSLNVAVMSIQFTNSYWVNFSPQM